MRGWYVENMGMIIRVNAWPVQHNNWASTAIHARTTLQGHRWGLAQTPQDVMEEVNH